MFINDDIIYRRDLSSFPLFASQYSSIFLSPQISIILNIHIYIYMDISEVLEDTSKLARIQYSYQVFKMSLPMPVHTNRSFDQGKHTAIHFLFWNKK